MVKHTSSSFTDTGVVLDKQGDWALIRRLSVYIRPFQTLLMGAAFFLGVSLFLDLIRPLLLKQTIDRVIPSHDIGVLVQLSSFYLATILVGCVTLFIQNYLLALFGQKVIYDIRNTVFTKIISRTLQVFTKIPIGNLVTSVTNDIESLRTLYTDVLLKLISSSLLILGMLVSMYFLNVTLALVVTALLPLMGGTILVYQKYARRAFRGVRTKLAASNTSVQEMLNLILLIKSYLAERLIERKYEKISQEFLDAGLFEVKTFAIFRPIVDSLFFVATIAILWSTNIFSSVTDAGTVFAFLQYMNKLFQPLKDIAEKYNSLQSSLAGAERLLPIINEPTIEKIEADTIPQAWLPLREIRFDHVWFSYDNSETYALRDISFTLKAGTYTGIVGPSGSGKSTLLGLLMGTYRPNKGHIYINDCDLANYPATVIRNVMSYVFQDSYLFKGTILDNITLYDTAISLDQVVAAAKQAHLHELIEKLPKGYQTEVGYLGSLLSGGQRQLLSMARMFLRKRPVLLFDEATASIDSHTESLIQESLRDLRQSVTIISIAHRLSTVRDANLLLMIYKGQLCEAGTYDELWAHKGLFRNFVEGKLNEEG